MTDSGHIFISYARKDGGDHAGRLHTALESAGFRAWRDTRDIDPAQDFSAEIESGIEKASCVALCLTPESKRSDSFVRREIQYAQVLKKPVIPLRFAEIAPHVSVITNEWIDFYKGWDAAFDRLCTVLKRPTLDAAPLPAASDDDPFRDYLNALYQNIVRYLNLTVFSLVTLRGESAPDAVERAQVLPMAFFAMAGVESPDTERKQFQNFHEAFTEYNGRVLLLGDPGAGKTTTLFAFARDRVAARLEDPTLPLPILVPISTWDAQKQTPLLDWLTVAVPALKRDDLARLLDSKRALLLLDGLDELGNEREDPQTHDFYDPRLRFVEHIVEGQPAAPILISCRVKDYADIGHKVSLGGAVTLQPLDDNQMSAYLNDLPDLWAALQADLGLREIARTPLLLSLFTHAFRELPEEAKLLRDLSRGDLRDKIFETYVGQQYERERRKPANKLAFSLDEIYNILGSAASDNIIDSLPHNQIYLGNNPGLSNTSDLGKFKTLAAQLNLLVPINEKPNLFRFIHLALRDYFAFHYTVKSLRDAGHSHWKAIYALGQLGDARAIEPLIAALKDPEHDVRRLAVHALGKLGDNRILEPLSQLLNDPNPDVRTYIADTLWRFGSDGLDSLIEMTKDEDIRVQQAAIDAIGKIRDTRATQAVINVLKSNSSSHVRSVAAHVLGKMEQRDAQKHLTKALKDKDPRVRSSTVIGLWKLGNRKNIPLIVKALDDDDPNVRYCAALSLGKLQAIEATEQLIKTLEDSDGMVKQTASLALTQIGTPEALEAVRQWQEKENNPPQDSTQSQPDSN
ncbi:MAG: HEAT repeat domain-containing protein [Anaerolineae bacterium]|nr:HEAT repeat domain-containing protein [Anaerolineae bacterium]